jgi:hypothetical protein
VLIPENAPVDTPYLAAEYYVADESGVIRAPLFEGIYPIGLVEFTVTAPVGTPARLRCSYSSATGVTVALKVGSQAEVVKTIELTRSSYVGDRAALWERFVGLRTEAERLVSELPQWVPLVRSMNESCQAINLDIETEFANQLVLDSARVEDRLQHLQTLIWAVQAFPTTREGFVLTIENRRRRIVEEGGDVECLEKLDALEQDIPQSPTTEVILALTIRLHDIFALFLRRHPPQVTPEYVERYRRDISGQLTAIRRDGGDEQLVAEATDALASIVGSHDMTIEDQCFKLNSLWVEVEREYRRSVMQRQHQGLLSAVQPQA